MTGVVLNHSANYGPGCFVDKQMLICVKLIGKNELVGSIRRCIFHIRIKLRTISSKMRAVVCFYNTRAKLNKILTSIRVTRVTAVFPELVSLIAALGFPVFPATIPLHNPSQIYL